MVGPALVESKSKDLDSTYLGFGTSVQTLDCVCEFA